MTESQLQKKILNWLKANEWYAIKTITVNRAGCPDILCCINGVFVGIEVKIGRGKLSALQVQHLKEINAGGGIGIVVYSLEEAKLQLLHLLPATTYS